MSVPESEPHAEPVNDAYREEDRAGNQQAVCVHRNAVGNVCEPRCPYRDEDPDRYDSTHFALPVCLAAAATHD